MKFSWKQVAIAAGVMMLGAGCVAEVDTADEPSEFRNGVGSFCGGIAGFPCDGNLLCVDDPDDDCDPLNGGADCGGICVPPSQRPPCKLAPEECPADCVLDHACPAGCHCPGPGVECGDHVCSPQQQCCVGQPFPEPTCFDGDICPISRRRHKADIHYLGATELERLHGELMDHKVASYRYVKDGTEGPSHLGFIIDDVAPSPSVGADGERVNMYGYTTMAVAALQVQQARIEELEQKLARLEAKLEAATAK